MTTDQPIRMTKPYEVTFWGDATTRDFPRYRRYHATYEHAHETALQILAKLDHRAAHPAIIYGPGCGKDGTTIT